jgi:hypothetical protein
MSGINGDKARFNRRRKKKISRRERQRGMFGWLPKQAEATAPPSAGKSKEKLA